MALEPFKVRLTADLTGTLDEVIVRIALVDRAPSPEDPPAPPPPT